jgi:predicted DNA-binding transcriptional regulator AlpA
MLRPLLDAEDIANLIDGTRKSVSDLLYRNPESLPPSFKVGGLRRWHPNDVDEWLDEQRVNAKHERQERLDAIGTTDLRNRRRTLQRGSSDVLLRVAPALKGGTDASV